MSNGQVQSIESRSPPGKLSVLIAITLDNPLIPVDVFKKLPEAQKTTGLSMVLTSSVGYSATK